MFNKKNILAFAIVMALVMLPAATMLMPRGIESLDVRPVRDYALSTDCVVTTADSGVTNADDTDNLYGGGYKTYIVTANCSYAGNGTNIVNITIEFYKSAVSYFSFLYTSASETATEASGASYVRIGTVTNATSLTYANITVEFKIEWAHPDIDDVDLNITAWNAVNSTSGQKDANYDIDTDLVLTPTALISLADYGTGKMVVIESTTFSYEDSGGNNYPLDAETDFVLTRTPSSGMTDSFNPSSYTDGTGVAVWADVIAGSVPLVETYTITAYTQATTTTDLTEISYTDTITLTHDGAGADPPADTGLSPNIIGLAAAVVIVGYLCMKSGKGGDVLTAKRKPKKRKKRKKR